AAREAQRPEQQADHRDRRPRCGPREEPEHEEDREHHDEPGRGPSLARDEQGGVCGRQGQEHDRDPQCGHRRHGDLGELYEVGLRRQAEGGLAVLRREDGEREGGEGEDRECDRRLPARDDGRLEHDDLRRGSGLLHCGAHFAFTSWETSGTALRLGDAGSGRRKIVRTSGGAAMKSTMRDCTTSTISIGTPSAACIEKPPALKAPNRMPAMKMPHGVERPSRATVIASKPMPASMPAVNPVVTVPSTCLTPARPSRAPELDSALMYIR